MQFESVSNIFLSHLAALYGVFGRETQLFHALATTNRHIALLNSLVPKYNSR
jgi:hypothetical protein